MGVTAAQRRAARNLLDTAKFSARSTTGELSKSLGIYDQSDKQAKASAGVQFRSNSAAAAAERFSQLKNLQGSARGVLSSAGNALQGSQLGSLGGLLRERNDLDTGEVLGTLRTNQQGVQGALTENLNDTGNKRRAAINAAVLQLRNLEASTSTDLNNVNALLYKKPGRGSTNLGSGKTAKKLSKIKNIPAKAAGYILPDAAPIAQTGQTMPGTSYFDKLMNMYNQRSA